VSVFPVFFPAPPEFSIPVRYIGEGKVLGNRIVSAGVEPPGAAEYPGNGEDEALEEPVGPQRPDRVGRTGRGIDTRSRKGGGDDFLIEKDKSDQKIAKRGGKRTEDLSFIHGYSVAYIGSMKNDDNREADL
jgi:hypothetical protein